jgi:hypothetical protein
LEEDDDVSAVVKMIERVKWSTRHGNGHDENCQCLDSPEFFCD